MYRVEGLHQNGSLLVLVGKVSVGQVEHAYTLNCVAVTVKEFTLSYHDGYIYI